MKQSEIDKEVSTKKYHSYLPYISCSSLSLSLSLYIYIYIYIYARGKMAVAVKMDTEIQVQILNEAVCIFYIVLMPLERYPLSYSLFSYE